MKSEKTVNDAATLLPEDIQKIFIEIFESLEVLDIYGGDLKSYFLVIAQEFKRRKLLSNKLCQALWLLHENSNPNDIERGVSKLVG